MKLPSANSIFVKSIAILVASCTCLAAIVSYLGDRAGREIAESGVIALAENQTTVIASQLHGPVRFNKLDDVASILEKAVGANDLIQTVIVVDAAGQIVSSLGQPLQPTEAAALVALANEARTANTDQHSPDGLSMAYPVRRAAGEEPIAAVASVWTTGPFLATISRYRKKQIAGTGTAVLLLMVIASFAIRGMISRPIDQISARAIGMADGDLTSETPEKDSKSEIGGLARSIDTLRQNLWEADENRKTALFQSAGFSSSSAAMIMCDLDMTVSTANQAFESLVRTNVEHIRMRAPDFDPENIIGNHADIFGDANLREVLRDASFPFERDIESGGKIFNLKILPVIDTTGERQGYVLELKDATDSRKSHAIFDALEAASLRADFAKDGQLLAKNSRLTEIAGETTQLDLSASVFDVEDQLVWPLVCSGKPHIGQMRMLIGQRSLLIDGSISPIKNRSGQTTGFVLMGTDITEAQARLEEARNANEKMSSAQNAIVTELRKAMGSLSAGDLKVRIEEPFIAEYDILRKDFNSAVDALDTAIREILVSADTIRNEADSVSGTADAFSRRTEQQAATLEETAAAISELTASVASTAQGAKQTNDVVTKARDDAASSGTIVQETVDAMSAIESSAEQISRIISVIDEIAFQTNLLALNAGVEAARAGEAGRGFAVVASEVRALAQRSSDAAQEISELISTSGEHVKRGVSLVDKAGDALTEIAGTIGDVADHVAAIAASAKEQATGVDEINSAMSQLDQVTQQNVAMFEETMAASQSLTAEADGLVTITRRFECSPSTARVPSAPNSGRGAHRTPEPKETQAKFRSVQKPRPPIEVEGNLAIALPPTVSEDDWEEF